MFVNEYEGCGITPIKKTNKPQPPSSSCEGDVAIPIEIKNYKQNEIKNELDNLCKGGRRKEEVLDFILTLAYDSYKLGLRTRKEECVDLLKGIDNDLSYDEVIAYILKYLKDE